MAQDQQDKYVEEQLRGMRMNEELWELQEQRLMMNSWWEAEKAEDIQMKGEGFSMTQMYV